LSRFILKLFGWRFIGEPPEQKKYVVIIGPHTSNWDFVIFLLVKMTYQLKVVFIGKHTIFIWPFSLFLKKIGGIPVERSSKHNVVDAIAEEFSKRDEMVFALSPEGTRSYLDHWKSGFYFIARKARVPVQCAFLDAPTKTLGWGPIFNLSDDKDADLKRIESFYADKRGFKPEKFSKIVFKDSGK